MSSGLQNAGSLTAYASGVPGDPELTLAGPILNTGTFTVHGTVDLGGTAAAVLTNDGTIGIAPGGLVAMTGSSTVANEHDGLLAFGISGAPNASAAYGRITAGALSLGGTVDPVFEHGFAPPAGSEYVVDTGASSGSFATVLQGATADYSHAGEVGLIGGGPPTATTTSLTTSAPTGLPFEQSVRLTATVRRPPAPTRPGQ